MAKRTSRGRLVLGLAAATVIAVITPTWAHASPSATHGPAHQIYTSPQPASNADFSGHGANVHGPYDSTRSGAPSLNGNGVGTAVGKPCAGCVGKADNKNPEGQMPNGSDPNAGYECDRNHGIGRTNPAHTGCVALNVSGSPTPSSSSSSSPSSGSSSSPPSSSPASSGSTSTGATSSTAGGTSSAAVAGVSAARTPGSGAPTQAGSRTGPSAGLAATGSPLAVLVGVALVALMLGAVLQLAHRRRAPTHAR